MTRKKLLQILLVLFTLGAIISGYLYYSKVINQPVICPNSGCDIVANSPYAHLLGVPVALWGVLYYVGMFILTVLYYKKPSFLLQTLLGVGIGWGALYTIYLRYLEFFKIGALCIWCWASVIVMIGVVICGYFLYKKRNQEL